MIWFRCCFGPPWKRSISEDGDKIDLLNLELSTSFIVASGNIFEWRHRENKISSGEIDLLRCDRSPHWRSWPRAHGGVIWLSADSRTNGEEISAKLLHVRLYNLLLVKLVGITEDEAAGFERLDGGILGEGGSGG